MEIYEKIFDRLEELNISQVEFSRRTGISTSTISDWKKKKINPQASKIVPICKALNMELGDLLCVADEIEMKQDYKADEKHLIECYRNMPEQLKKRFLAYLEWLLEANEAENRKEICKQKRNISVFQDVDGHNVIVINDIRFKGKRSVDWDDVEVYLREYVGEFYQIAETKDIIYIGTDLPGEYTGSLYTKRLKGAAAKAKANAAQALPELIEFSTSKAYEENKKDKHARNAKRGWYRYEARFALPVYGDDGELERYNVFGARLLIRHAASGKLYLYDITEIKKETSKSCQA